MDRTDRRVPIGLLSCRNNDAAPVARLLGRRESRSHDFGHEGAHREPMESRPVNATTSPLARIANVIIVLVLAAAAGLMAGNVLSARDAGPAGGPGPFPNVWGNHADISAAAGVPSYADPHRGHIQEGAAAADPVTSESWGNVAATTPAESLTAPSLR